MLLQMALFHSFLWLSITLLCIYTTPSLSIHLGHLDCLHHLVIVTSAAVNIRVHVFFLIIVLSGYMPRYGTPGHVVTLSLVF